MLKTKKRILFINRQSPYGTALAQEALDILLMASTFEQSISVVFMNEGVLQLKTTQNPTVTFNKNFCAAFKALSLYDIKNVYVEAESLRAYGLAVTDLITPVELKNSAELMSIIQQQDIIFNT